MDDKSSAGFDRRTFLTAGVAAGVIGGGLVLGIRYANKREAAGSRCIAGARWPRMPSCAWRRTTPSPMVIGKSEMGQGIYTGLAMALAEELDVDPARVNGGICAAWIRRSMCHSCPSRSPAAA